jgi:DNA-binding transcriptional LysR family regulator
VYDGVTLDQLRALVAVADAGSFSAAARQLRRVQSAISTSMGNLEEALGVSIWDRSRKVATLTEAGRAVLGAARRVLAEVDGLQRLTESMAAGLETTVSLCLDAFFPLPALTELCTAFALRFPEVELRVEHRVLSGVSERVLSGAASLGVASPAGLLRGLEARALSAIRMVPVAAPGHPLAAVRGPIEAAFFSRSVQIVLSEGGGGTSVADQGVLSPRTWRVGDLHTKRELLRAGLGWGNLPEHLVRADVQAGDLVIIRPAAWADDEHVLHLSAVYRTNAALGPAHRWVTEQLAQLCAAQTEPGQGQPERRAAPPRRARPARERR